MSNVDSWCKACGEVELPSELQDLEDAIHHHQGIYEHITLAYSEVSVLFVSLDKIVSFKVWIMNQYHLLIGNSNAELLFKFYILDFATIVQK